MKGRKDGAYSDLALDSDGELLVQPNANGGVLQTLAF